jgi:hypothetical protein
VGIDWPFHGSDKMVLDHDFLNQYLAMKQLQKVWLSYQAPTLHLFVVSSRSRQSTQNFQQRFVFTSYRSTKIEVPDALRGPVFSSQYSLKVGARS